MISYGDEIAIAIRADYALEAVVSAFSNVKQDHLIRLSETLFNKWMQAIIRQWLQIENEVFNFKIAFGKITYRKRT